MDFRALKVARRKGNLDTGYELLGYGKYPLESQIHT